MSEITVAKKERIPRAEFLENSCVIELTQYKNKGVRTIMRVVSNDLLDSDGSAILRFKFDEMIYKLLKTND